MSLLFPLRIVLFYFLLAFTAFVWCLVSLVFAPFMAFRARYRFVVQNWCRCAIWLGKTLVGLRYEVHGAENVPARPCVIRQAPEHLGDLLSFGLLRAADPGAQARVAAGAVLRLGDHAAQAHRHRPRQPKGGAAPGRQAGSRATGAGRLGADLSGRYPCTGRPAGQVLRSGAALAVNAGLPVLPIAHNAGMFWPKAGWGKRPGTIQVVIGPPMMAESEGPRAVAELNQRAEDWVNAQVSQLEVQGRPTH